MFDIIPKAPLLPVKKRNKLHDFTQFYIILLHSISFPVRTDIKQILHY